MKALRERGPVIVASIALAFAHGVAVRAIMQSSAVEYPTATQRIAVVLSVISGVLLPRTVFRKSSLMSALWSVPAFVGSCGVLIGFSCAFLPHRTHDPLVILLVFNGVVGAVIFLGVIGVPTLAITVYLHTRIQHRDRDAFDVTCGAFGIWFLAYHLIITQLVYEHEGSTTDAWLLASAVFMAIGLAGTAVRYFWTLYIYSDRSNRFAVSPHVASNELPRLVSCSTSDEDWRAVVTRDRKRDQQSDSGYREPSAPSTSVDPIDAAVGRLPANQGDVSDALIMRAIGMSVVLAVAVWLLWPSSPPRDQRESAADVPRTSSAIGRERG